MYMRKREDEFYIFIMDSEMEFRYEKTARH